MDALYHGLKMIDPFIAGMICGVTATLFAVVLLRK
jgi:hypothetical protein